jgi:hypothetical protein
MSDHELEHLDASYVLGALTPAERREFEQHLEECRRCTQSVLDLAGIPGLLGRLDEEVVTSLDDRPPLPATMLPALLREAARERRRRRVLVAAAAVGLAAAVALLTTLLSGALDGRNAAGSTGDAPVAAARATQNTARAVPMAQLHQRQLSAALTLQSAAWGTRVSVTCTYHGTPPKSFGPLDYALVVHTRAGAQEQVGTWRAVPGRAATFQAATATRPEDIASVEVQTLSGFTLLRRQL